MRNSVAAERQVRGWLQDELAIRAGVSRQTIISIEKERYEPRLPLAFRLAHIFNCRIEDLFTPDPAPSPRQDEARAIAGPEVIGFHEFASRTPTGAP